MQEITDTKHTLQMCVDQKESSFLATSFRNNEINYCISRLRENEVPFVLNRKQNKTRNKRKK